MVSPQNPFKEKKQFIRSAPSTHDGAYCNRRLFAISSIDIEFNLPKPSYTIDTLTYLKEQYPAHNFALIMGGDNLNSFHKWKNYEQILEEHELYIYPRPESKDCALASNPKVHLTQAPLMDISASFIRKSIADKKDISYFLLPKVWQYMDEMNFYK